MPVVEVKAATEERMRAELSGKRYVHIATHGYFEPDHLPSLLLNAEEKKVKTQIGEQIKSVGLLPGQLSGLVFTGVSGGALMSLRRAFSVAGSDTFVSSLWKVDDKATAQLMKYF